MRNLILACCMPLLMLIGLGPAAAELEHMEDQFLISQQVAKYAQMWDRKDAEAFAELFTEDGVMEWHFAGATGEAPSIAGQARIQGYPESVRTGRLAGRQSRHHFIGLVFEELQEARALTEHIFMATHVVDDEAPVLQSTGIYRIEWRKTDAGWRIANRKLFVDWPAPSQ